MFSDKTLGSILMKVCTHVHGSKISVVFTKGQKSLKPFQNSCLFNYLRTIRLKQLIIYENQSNLTEAGKNNTVSNFVGFIYNNNKMAVTQRIMIYF